MRIGLPLLFNVGWGLFALIGVPKLFGVPLSFIRYLAPDFGTIVAASGAVALIWALVRTLLAYSAVRKPLAPRPVSVVAGL
jgi:hypothetical protein